MVSISGGWELDEVKHWGFLGKGVVDVWEVKKRAGKRERCVRRFRVGAGCTDLGSGTPESKNFQPQW